MSEKIITLATFSNYTEASIVKSKLESIGIKSIICDGNIFPYLPFFSAKFGIRLQILQSDKKKA
ncbi:MAG: hypothetical protein O6939_08265, partial [Bacteroidetes bacterium]|nr:hypothetical protein [Bacteroidota bacterium]